MIYGEKVLQEHKNLKILKGDIRDLKLIERESKDCDVFIHLACISNDPSFELNPKLGKSINLDAFEPIVKIAKKIQFLDLFMHLLHQSMELKKRKM